jgi:hypothetical protein
MNHIASCTHGKNVLTSLIAALKCGPQDFEVVINGTKVFMDTEEIKTDCKYLRSVMPYYYIEDEEDDSDSKVLWGVEDPEVSTYVSITKLPYGQPKPEGILLTREAHKDCNFLDY